MARLRVSAVERDFTREVASLRRVLATTFANNLPGNQRSLLVESIFMRLFRAHENFLEDVFVLYTQERPTVSGKTYRSYLRPRNFEHAADLIQSNMPFLDWANPEKVLERAETYLEQNNPISINLQAGKDELLDLKRLRNHIAHNSRESLSGYEKTLRRKLAVMPLVLPSVGEFLAMNVRNLSPPTSHIDYAFDFLSDLAHAITS